jgi:hypothetical protein
MKWDYIEEQGVQMNDTPMSSHCLVEFVWGEI